MQPNRMKLARAATTSQPRRRLCERRQIVGFTLVELLVVIAIIGILIAQAD
jgi:prepilin-type N-terminal cleavage/methylation domain-containing protein